ncbi:ras family-domain-containing protein [Russula earlei]|uniref:Ras family-domain-containing protein n=1 Tax=Russula earlei TaxID=71964 RepID=A0ACC0UEI9_9AGAM|nr:ras family-domain-containing protein [Russula earlei]
MSSQNPVLDSPGACGKTSLLCSFALGEFPKEYIAAHLDARLPNLIAIFENYVAEIRLDGKAVQLALWDTAGQEEYERLRPLSYSKSHVILIAFAIDTPGLAGERHSQGMAPAWIEEVRSICGPIIPIILVGCKADLRPPSNDPNIDRYVSRAEAERVAQAIGARAYKECSALRIEGVDDVFEAATRASMLMREGVSGATHTRRRSSVSGDRDATHGGRCCVIC